MTDEPKNLETLRLAYEQQVADYIVTHGEDYDGSSITAAHDAYIAAIRRGILEAVEPMLPKHAAAAFELEHRLKHGTAFKVTVAENGLKQSLSAIKAAITGVNP